MSRRPFLRVGIVLGLVAATSSPASRAADAPDRVLFFEASRLAAAGKTAEALDAFEALGARYPGSSFVDDALYRRAQILDRELRRYDEAMALYGRLVREHPNSALALRVRARMLSLEEGLRTGVEPLRAYEEVLARYPERPPAESIARMERVRAEYPGFVYMPDVLLWLGSEYTRLPDGEARARAAFEEARRRWPSGATWYRAMTGLADLERFAGRYEAARALYLEVADKASTVRERDAGRQYADQMDEHLQRRWMLYGFAAIVFAALAVVAVRVPWGTRPWEHLRAARLEIALTVPAFAVLLALAWTRGPIARTSVALIGLVAVMAVVLNAAYLANRPPRRPWSFVYPLVPAVAVFGAIYAVFYFQDLVFVIEDTIRYGPD